MKVILPVAGYGTRLKPHTEQIQKALLPVAGKAVLDHIVEQLLAADIDRITFIVGHLGEQIVNHMRRYEGDFSFINQTERLGLGHAVLQGLEDRDEPVLVHLGDAVYHFPFADFKAMDINGIAVLPVDDPRRFGVVEMNGDNIIGFHEKVEQPPSNLAIIGLYFFRSERRLKQAIEHLIEHDIRTKNEYQITDAMDLMVRRDEPFTALHHARWYDAGVPATYLETNRRLLKSQHEELAGIEFHEPVFIGENCHISSSRLGPNVTVMDNCVIENCRIENSIILAGSQLVDQEILSAIVGGDGSRRC